MNLPYIEPELREDRGEIQAARKNRLPELIKLDDIRGDLHVHTNESDSHDTLEDMVSAAREKAYAYLAISNHPRHVGVAKGLNRKRLGIRQARRGWLEADDVLNTRSWKELKKILQRT